MFIPLIAAGALALTFVFGAATCDHAGFESAKECTAHYQQHNKK